MISYIYSQSEISAKIIFKNDKQIKKKHLA